MNSTRTAAGPTTRTRRRTIHYLGTAAAVLLLGLFLGTVGTPVGSATAAVQNHCNSVDNTPGLGMECDVAVVNNINLSTGVTSSTMTIRECHGAANTAPSSCSGPTVINSTELINTVEQCNSSINGGGGSLLCTVTIVNNITGSATAVAATINQCNDSLDTGTMRACSPDGSSTTGAAIHQCNNSDNGGGSSLTCSVSSGSTTSSAVPVTVNQCNFSANGGGSLIVCSVSMTNNIIPIVVVVPPVVVPPVVVPPVVVPPVVVPPVVVVPPDTTPGTGGTPGLPFRSVEQPSRLPTTGAETPLFFPAAAVLMLGTMLVLVTRLAPQYAKTSR